MSTIAQRSTVECWLARPSAIDHQTKAQELLALLCRVRVKNELISKVPLELAQLSIIRRIGNTLARGLRVKLAPKVALLSNRQQESKKMFSSVKRYVRALFRLSECANSIMKFKATKSFQFAHQTQHNLLPKQNQLSDNHRKQQLNCTKRRRPMIMMDILQNYSSRVHSSRLLLDRVRDLLVNQAKWRAPRPSDQLNC